MYAYGVANFVPMTVPETCCLTPLLDSKKLVFNKNSAIFNVIVCRNRFRFSFF